MQHKKQTSTSAVPSAVNRTVLYGNRKKGLETTLQALLAVIGYT